MPELPVLAWLWIVPLLCAGGIWVKAVRLVLAFAVGFGWALFMAHQRLDDRLAPEFEATDIELVGVVSGLPATTERGVRFELEPEFSQAKLPGRILLSWYRSATTEEMREEQSAALTAPVHPGERYQLSVRLRRPHGLFNPHGFDYEAWLLERGIGATGYVRSRPAPALLGLRDAFADRIEQLRESVRDRFKRVLGETPAAGILAALAVGDQRAISAEEWRLFNRTGVTHLMSISGLHVTLVSGLFAWIVSWLWRRSARLCLRLPARKAAAAAAIVGALGYTLIAGFAVPAQRTFWMVTVVALALWTGRIASPARTLALALGVVLVFDPWAVLAPGFWLSFGAVALIFFVSRAKESAARQWVRIQWAITLGLTPASLFLFSQVSLVGPIANAVAIPLTSAVITPIALVAAVLPWEAPLHLAAWLMQWQLVFLEWCASLPAALWQQHAPPLWSVLLGIAGVLWLLAPRGVPWRVTGLALMLPAVAIPPAAPALGEAWVTTLDVGQGLAVLVRTAERALLYDAGPAFGADADSGERVIAPYLRATGIGLLDAMIITHNDNDHAGGAASVLENVEVDEFLSSLPQGHPLHGLALWSHRCVAGQSWEWDGVRFELLHPAPDAAHAKRSNDLSCVLKVSAGGRSMLLTGDIEKGAEADMLWRDRDRLRSDVLLVPHHGSRTSSTPEFLAAVGATAAVIPVGYRNRFGHPNGEVLGRLAMEVFRTDRRGAITAKLSALKFEFQSERLASRRYWRDAPP